MTIKPNSTSYPYLAIALRHGLPYADVLQAADYLSWAYEHGAARPATVWERRGGEVLGDHLEVCVELDKEYRRWKMIQRGEIRHDERPAVLTMEENDR